MANKYKKKDEIRIIRGRTVRLTVNLRHKERPYRLREGEILQFTVKRNHFKSTPLIVKYGTEIVIEPEETLLLEPGIYHYDVVLYKVNGDMYTIIPDDKPFGICVVERGVYELGDSEEGTGLPPYATEEYVDTAIANAINSFAIADEMSF